MFQHVIKTLKTVKISNPLVKFEISWEVEVPMTASELKAQALGEIDFIALFNEIDNEVEIVADEMTYSFLNLMVDGLHSIRYYEGNLISDFNNAMIRLEAKYNVRFA